jgi:GT2 family glycosyltransferase
VSNNPKVSIVVLSLNGEKVIAQCLSSLEKTEYPNLEILVVNNGSSDKTPEIVSTQFPKVRLINLPNNLGFAGGNKVGILESTGDVVILLNDDTTVEPNWVSEIVKEMEKHYRIGIAGCKIYYPDGKILQHAGGYINNHGLSNHYGKGELDTGKYDTVRDVDYIMGAAFVIQREVIKKLGLLDTNYHPIYFEETDYCYRARKLGYRVVYIPTSVIYHYEAQTTVMGSAGFFYKYHKNRIRFMLKNFSAEQLAKAIEPEFRWFMRIKSTIELKPVLKAYGFNFIRFPLTLMERWMTEYKDWTQKRN